MAHQSISGSRQRHDRLAIETEPILLDRVSERGGESDFAVVSGGPGAFLLINADPIAPAFLRRVAGDIGLGHRLSGALGFRRYGGKTDTHTDAKGSALPEKPIFPQVGNDHFTDFAGPLQGTVVEQQTELVTTEPGERVPSPKLAFQ